MSALDHRPIRRALDAYVRACGGDPNRASSDLPLAERDLDEAIEAYAREVGGESIPRELIP